MWCSDIIENMKIIEEELSNLCLLGSALYLSMRKECGVITKNEEFVLEDMEQRIGYSVRFTSGYQVWYSEAHRVVMQILPERIADFEQYYYSGEYSEKTIGNYCIKDYLNGIKESIVGKVIR